MKIPNLYEDVKSGRLKVTSKSPSDWRFWASLDKHGPYVRRLKSRCWVWTGAQFRDKYGCFSHDYINEVAHRFSWRLLVGPIPKGLMVLHACDNRPCVNPAHLFLGDATANSHDMFAKGRANIKLGEAHGMAVLTEAIVRYVRRVHVRRHPRFGCKPLARMFNVDYSTMRWVIKGMGWKHVK